jgi:hypothetical protein
MEAVEQGGQVQFAALPDDEIDLASRTEGIAAGFRRTTGQDDHGAGRRPAGLAGGAEAVALGPGRDGAAMDNGGIAGIAEWRHPVPGAFELRRHTGRLGLVQSAADGFEGHYGSHTGARL